MTLPPQFGLWCIRKIYNRNWFPRGETEAGVKAGIGGCVADGAGSVRYRCLQHLLLKAHRSYTAADWEMNEDLSGNDVSAQYRRAQ